MNANAKTQPLAPPVSAPPTASAAPPAPRPDARQRLRFAALALGSGVLWFLGCPDFDLWPLSWVAMVPVLFVVDRARTGREAFFYAWLAGVVGNAGGFYWITGLLERFAHLPWLAAALAMLLLAAYQAVVFGLFGLATRSIRQRLGLPAALVAPLAMVTFELLLPVVFPFYVGITQAWQVHVIQVADVTGPIGVSALLLMVNGAVYDLLADGGRRWRAAAGAALVLVAALGYGHFRIRQQAGVRAAAPTLRVGLVQPNLRFDLKGGERMRLASDQLRDLQEQSRRLEAEGAELLVWPETSYPYALSRNLARDFPTRSEFRIRAGFDAPLVFGAVTRAPRGRGERYPYNSALMLDRDGRLAGRFDKTFLLIGGEYTPGRDTFPWIARMVPETAGQYARGRDVVALPLRTADGRSYRLGPMICYEDILPAFNRRLAALHPHLLVNVTNDAWFGDTSEPWEHLALSVFRAVEMRTDLVRAVNTGVSAFVDATGRVFARTYAVDPAVDPRPADGIVARVALVEGGHTFYARFGDVFAWLCALATAGLWLWGRRRGQEPAAG